MADVVKFPRPDPKRFMNDLVADLIAMESNARELEQLEPGNPDLSSLRASLSTALNEALKTLRDLKKADDEAEQQ